MAQSSEKQESEVTSVELTLQEYDFQVVHRAEAVIGMRMRCPHISDVMSMLGLC